MTSAIHPPSIKMSHLLTHNLHHNHHHNHNHNHNNSLLSPISPLDSSPWHHQLYSPVADSFNNYTYFSSASSSSSSSSPTDSLFKMRLSPETPSSDSEQQQQLCLPTHKVFDFTEQHQSMPPKLPTVSINTPMPHVSVPAKRSSTSPSPAPVKKRTVGERISSKDFIPPDVTGLTKREARLVKNRAAAFLSRQRKREEFEAMEIRVAELEQENARLHSLAQNSNTPASAAPALATEVDLLRAQLAAAEARERQLNAELARKEAEASQPAVKVEAPESQYDLSRPTPPVLPSSKSNASLGLMVLLCALPSLFSVPGHSSNVPSTFSLPAALSASSSYDFNSFDYDWANAGSKDQSQIPTPKPSFNLPKRLEFADVDEEALRALGDLDISFDTISAEDGKIRVRIIPSTSASSSRAGSPASSSNAMKLDDQAVPSSTTPFNTWGADTSTSFDAFASAADFGLTSQDDPFLGIGGISDYLSSASSISYGQDLTQSPTSSVSSELPASDAGSGSKRRVRIALKSLPKEGGEGGEWEVQVY